jgi:Tol biopolymer transport system component
MTGVIRVLAGLAIAAAGVGVYAGPAFAAVCDIERVSVSETGVEGDGPSARFGGDVAISAAGRYVLFGSEATNLVPGGTDGSRNLFLADSSTNSLELISVALDGTPGGQSGFGQVNADGRYVVFQSCAPNLVFGDTNHTCDVFVRDRLFGTTEVVSLSGTGALANDGSAVGTSISDDGRFAAFTSRASNLVPGDTNGAYDVFLRDRQTGTTIRVSEAIGGGDANGVSQDPFVSADGRFVSYESAATNLVTGDTNSASDVFRYEVATGTTSRVSVSGIGDEAGGTSGAPSLSGDGGFVAFFSAASNLVPADTAFDDVFVRDNTTGVVERVSVSAGGGQANANSGPSLTNGLSVDGRFAVFQSVASNLVAGDTNGRTDVFVRDRLTGATTRVNVPGSGVEADADSFNTAISGDGGVVAFASEASNLVPGDTNGTTDVFTSVCRPSSTAIALDPVAATNEVGTNHTVTATVTDLGQPLTGVAVQFGVSGSVTAAGSCTTDALGQCSFTYTGPAVPGADLITAYADDDGDAAQDSTEPAAAATKAWTSAAVTSGRITGGGHVLHVAFGFNARSDGVVFRGDCNLVDRLADVRVRCLDVTSVQVVGTHATIRGNATVNGVATTYVIDVDDLHEPGPGLDTFKLATSSYTTGGPLTQGNIQIH